MFDESTGVTAGASTAADSSASADTGGQEATNPTVQGIGEDGLTAPAQPVAENVNGADAGVEGFAMTEEELAQAPEQWREKFKSLLGGYKSLEADHKPLKSWVDQRGGMDYVRSDVETLDKLFSSNPDERMQFYQAFRQQDSEAFGRFMTDITTDPTVQQEVLRSIDPQQLLSYVEQAGLLPQGMQVDQSVLASIPNGLQEVFRSLPPAVQEDYGKMTPELRNWNLQRDSQLYNIQKADRERAQNQRAQAQHEQKSKVYNDVRSIIQSALTEKIPGNQEAMNFVLQATETALYQSPEGAALWNELEHLIDTGQTRGLREKLPLIIAKAKQIATTHATWLNGMESKARQFDELMRLGSQEDIIRYLNQIRGGMKQPGPGTTPAPTNGAIPKPELAGQYSRENVLSYGSRS